MTAGDPATAARVMVKAPERCVLCGKTPGAREDTRAVLLPVLVSVLVAQERVLTSQMWLCPDHAEEHYIGYKLAKLA